APAGRMIVGSNFMITKEKHPVRVFFLRDHEERRARQQKGGAPPADMSRTRAPGFGPLVASRPVS
ncbi:MAG: hypothetical protein WAL13_10325, partial [Trebonia sp.]